MKNKKNLSELLGVQTDSLEKAISRMRQRGITDPTDIDIFTYYAVPNPRRDPATVAAAQELLRQMQSQGQQSPDSSPEINPEPAPSPNPEPPIIPDPEPEPSPEPEPPIISEPEVLQEMPAEETQGFSISRLLANREVLAVLVLIGAVAMAKAITAPIFMSVGIGFTWAYILSFYVDLAGFVFVWHRRHVHGKLFALSTALQTALTVGALSWMGTDAVVITKGLTVSACLGIAVHGFSEIIAKK